jgi:F420-0:gamma-glutamyl ligase-like protein
VAVPIAVNVDLGIAEAVRLVDQIISRRDERRRQVVKDVLDDVEAAVIVVRRLDKLFTDILSEFASSRVSEDSTLLAALVDETRKFLFGRQLLPILDGRREAIRNAAGDTRREAGNLRGLQPVLGRVAYALDAYRANLDQAMGHATAPGRLANVYSLAYSRVNGADLSATQIREEAEETLRQHDFSLSERIYTVSGELAQAARGR